MIPENNDKGDSYVGNTPERRWQYNNYIANISEKKTPLIFAEMHPPATLFTNMDQL